jgi:fructose-1-phosphate kinase PfkB-like protein
MINWKTTVSGIVAALGVALTQINDPIIHAIGVILSGVGALLVSLTAKDYNVHGGTVAQATPPAVQASSEAQGVQSLAK